MPIDQDLVRTLVNDVLLAGPAPSGPTDTSNAAFVQLVAARNAAQAQIYASQGRQVTSANAGESVSWQTDGKLQDLYGAYSQAVQKLCGRMTIVRETSAVFLP